MGIHVYHHIDPGGADPRFDPILRALQELRAEMSVQLDALKAIVPILKDTITAAITQIQGQAAQNAALKAENDTLKTENATLREEPVALTPLTADLTTANTSLSATVVANQPPATPPATPPAGPSAAPSRK